MKIKTDKYTHRLWCITSIWRALTKLKNTKKKKEAEQHFYDGAQNRHRHY